MYLPYVLRTASTEVPTYSDVLDPYNPHSEPPRAKITALSQWVPMGDEAMLCFFFFSIFNLNHG